MITCFREAGVPLPKTIRTPIAKYSVIVIAASDVRFVPINDIAR